MKHKTTLILAAAAVISLSLIGGNDGDKNLKNKTSKLEKIDATTICNIRVEDVSKYGARFPFSYFSSIKFYKYDNGSGYRLVRNFDIKNAYGQYSMSQASCRFNEKGKLTGLNIDRQKII